MTGLGNLAHPWDLATAVNLTLDLGYVKPGHTLWLRGGTHVVSAVSNIAGTAGNPINLRPYGAEKPIIDGGYRAQAGDLSLRDLHFLNSSWVTRLETTKPNAVSLDAGADRVEVVNCLIHDTNHGIQGEGHGISMRGCVVWAIGQAGSNQQHGLYVNNDGAVQAVISGNIFAQEFASWGMHLYSEVAGGFVRNALAENNLHIWQIMLLQTTVEEMAQIVVRNNETMHGQINMGTGGRDHLDLVCTGNMICFGKENNCLVVKRFRDLTVTGNTIITDLSPAINFVHSDLTIIQRTWDYNTYYYTGDPAKFANNNSVNQSFSQWQAATGLDAHSTYIEALPTVNRVRIIPNTDSAERAHILIHNWQGLGSVDVDLSGLGLANGKTYRLRQAQDPLGDTATFVYAGAPVAVSMSGHTVAAANGYGDMGYSSTFPTCGAFVLEAA